MQEGLLITESTVLNTANPRQLHVHYQIYKLLVCFDLSSAGFNCFLGWVATTGASILVPIAKRLRPALGFGSCVLVQGTSEPKKVWSCYLQNLVRELQFAPKAPYSLIVIWHIWYYGIMALWHYGIMVLWYFATDVGFRG